MQAVGRFGSYISRGVSTVSCPFLPFGGAVDIVVVQQKDGSFKSSPWYVRFGKVRRILKGNERVEVSISVNGVEPDFHMYMNQKGEAFFLSEDNSQEEEGELFSSSSGDDIDDDVQQRGIKRYFKSKSYNFDSDRSDSAAQVDGHNGKIVARTNSRRSRILRLVFGRNSMKGRIKELVDSMERAQIAANLLELKWSTNLTYDKLPPTEGSKNYDGKLQNGLFPSKLKEKTFSCNDQDDFSSKSNFEVPKELGKEDGRIKLAYLRTPDNVVENLVVNASQVSRRRVSFAEDGEHGMNVEKVVYDATTSDLQVACVELEASIEKQLNGEEVSGATTSGGCGPVHVHAEILHATTGLLPEVMEVSELHSQQRDYSHSDVDMHDVADLGNLQKFQKSQTVNFGRRRCSVKKLRAKAPTSEQLASLNLKEGRNTVTFSFSTATLGRRQVDARIYLWKWNTRIVISDVDGTITRSDVLGQFMPLVGIDWSQTGVAHLFSAIQENGYQLLFLSARAISQAYHTRQFLFNLNQDGKVLPDGPVVISPDGILPSLYREVIRKTPHEFKIACLEDIRALFPPDCNPFYAGFGNRDTDEVSYLKVGIPKGKVFIINPRGEIAVNHSLDTKSYTSLHAVVNGMFPPTNSSEQEDFNSWNYWKLPLML